MSQLAAGWPLARGDEQLGLVDTSFVLGHQDDSGNMENVGEGR